MRAVGVVLMMIGVLLGGTGGYASATYVRSGDWVVGPAAVVNPNNEHVVVSQYGLLSYDSDIRVTATSTSDAFLGTANPIDVDDYTAGVTHTTITSLSWRAIGTTSVTGAAKDLPATPTDVDIWLTKASGTSTELLITPGDEIPTQAILVSKKGDPITVRIDYRVAGIRTIVFGVIGVGGALALIGLVSFLVGIGRSRRRKNPKVAPAAPPVAPPYGQPGPPPNGQAGPPSYGQPVPRPYGQAGPPPYGQPVPPPYGHAGPPPAGQPGRPPWTQGPVSRVIAGLVAVTLVATSGGCSVPKVPKAPTHSATLSRAQITKVPLTSDQSTAVGDDLSHRTFQARLSGSPPSYSLEAWKQVFSDVPLQAYIFSTTYAKAAQTPAPFLTCSMTVDTVYGSVATSYPMVATVLALWSCGDNQPVKIYSVLTRAHSYAPWFIASESFAENGASPEPGRGQPTTTEQHAGSAASGAVLDYLNQKALKSLTAPDDLGTFSAACTEPTASAVHTMTATIVTSEDKQGSVRFAKTATGTLVNVSYVATCASQAKPGYEIWLTSPMDQVLGQTGHRTALTRKFGVTATLLIDGSTTTMVGFDALPVL